MPFNIELCLSQSRSFVKISQGGNQYNYDIAPHLLSILREILYQVIIKTLEEHANVNDIPLD